MNALSADDPFAITGATVSIEALLNTQLLAQDTSRLSNDRTKSRKAGDQRSFFRGQGREFIEMKHYQNGDDVRRIDWKITARKQLPFVRVMEEDRHAEQAIWLNLTPSCYFGTSRCLKSVMLVHWAAFLVWRFVHLKHPLRLMIQVGNQFDEFKISNKQQAAQACHALAASHESLANTYQTIPDTTNINWPNHWRGKPNLWILSDFQQTNLSALKQVIPVSRVNKVNLMQVVDQFDQELPRSGRLPVKHRSTQTVIDTEQLSARTDHANQFLLKQQSLTQFAHYFNGLLISASTQTFDWQDVTTWPV